VDSPYWYLDQEENKAKIMNDKLYAERSNMSNIFEELKQWREDRHIQKQDDRTFVQNMVEELFEYMYVDKDMVKNLTEEFMDKYYANQTTEHQKVDAICDMKVFGINHLETQGYDAEKCMMETIKEISSREQDPIQKLIWEGNKSLINKTKTKHISQEYVRELFFYRDGELYWRELRSSASKRNSPAGSFNAKGYRQVSIDGKTYRYHRLVYIYHNGNIDNNLEIDHIDRNKSNNKIENLRAVTSIENQWNKSNRGCIRYDESRGKWFASINLCNKRILNKRFKTQEEACAVLNDTRNNIDSMMSNKKWQKNRNQDESTLYCADYGGCKN
jgi:hypothetical protein